MQGDDGGGKSAAARARRDLQPSGGPRPVELGAPVSAADLDRLDGRHREHAHRLRASIDRRMKDDRIVRILAADGFEGPRYDRFIEELVRYGISVLRGWMYSGFIFQLIARRGFGLNPHELDLEELARDSDLREELATMTVACALPRFRRRALVEGGWSAAGGASITTYFMGACAYVFPNEFRKHRAARERHLRALRRQEELYEPAVGILSVAEEVVGNLSVLDELGGIDNVRARAAVALTVDGYTQEEIRQLLDAPTVRAVEGLLHRWRAKAKRNGSEGGVRHG
ncbi:hypothetical protein SUDANB120_05253 [Streptomyces sp. enrichment culture]|uniref:hypothetical protein n=1 Tax=Streptomyces sp. enrichment culture TaxID=1795815 RepID=UPI003F54F40D